MKKLFIIVVAAVCALYTSGYTERNMIASRINEDKLKNILVKDQKWMNLTANNKTGTNLLLAEGNDKFIDQLINEAYTIAGMPTGSLDTYGNNKLSQSNHKLTIPLSDLSFYDPKNILIYYKLEGYDNKWSEVPVSKSIHYDLLPSGRYKLLVYNSLSPKNISTFEIIVSGKQSALLWSIIIILTLVSITAIWLYIREKRAKSIASYDTKESKFDDNIQVNEDIPEKKKESSYSMRNFSEKECMEIIEKLDLLMINEKPYKNPNLRIHELASMVKSSSLQLSYILNTYKDGYYNYINAFRVNDFKEFVKNGEAQKYTLTAIALKCGFSSRTSFFRHFKSITGITPSIYMKDCPRDEESYEEVIEKSDKTE